MDNDILNDKVYPVTWDEYVGQDRAKRMLRLTAMSARTRGQNLPHLLIHTPLAGAGKTALALLTVRASGRSVYLASGKMTIEQVQIMFSKLDDGDIIFYDEIHQAASKGAGSGTDWMLQYLEQGVLVTPWGREQVPQVTIIGATTDKGLLSEPIQTRFQMIELEPYTDAEGEQLAHALALKVLRPCGLPKLHAETAKAVAKATNNQPRVMRKLLEVLRDLAVCKEIKAPRSGKYSLSDALDFAGLTEDGLTSDACAYLKMIYSEKQGAPTGAAAIRERLGMVGNGLRLTEQLLVNKGLLRMSGRGRQLTGDGIRRAASLAA